MVLRTDGINPDKEILEAFDQNTTYADKRYETRLLWKVDSKELNRFEIAKRRLVSLGKTLREK